MRTGISRPHSSSIVLLVTALACVAGCGQPQPPNAPTTTSTAVAEASLPLVAAAATPTSVPYPYGSLVRPVATMLGPAPGVTRAPLVYPPTTPYPTPTRAPTPTVTPTWTPRPTPTPEPTCTPVQRAEGAATGNSRAPAFAVEMLRNGAYFDRYYFGGRTVRLVDGKYEEKGPHPLQIERIIFVSVAYGDLQGDGIEDALVELRYWGGGTGHWAQLVVLLNEQGKPVQVATASLGDRERVVSLTIQDGIVTAEVLTQGQGDGACCPSKQETRRFRLDCHKLVKLP